MCNSITAKELSTCGDKVVKPFFGGKRILFVSGDELSDFTFCAKWTALEKSDIPKDFDDWKLHTTYAKDGCIVTIFSRDGS